jgi:hypothetical protein
VNMAEEYLTANAEKMKPKAKEDLVANLKEIREEIAARSKPTEPTSEAAPVAEDNEPVL